MFGHQFFHTPAQLKSLRKQLYVMLAQDYDVEELRFMNYGFVPDDADAGGMEIALDASEEEHRYAIQLYHHLVQPIGLEGKTVLEVGCGRGGGATYITRHLGPKSYTGMDLTQRAVRYCMQNNEYSNLRFIVGDAENLPFGEAAFDVVLNVESCHCYDPIENFLAGVRRVLVPGGYLLLTDFRDLMGVDDLRRALFRSGLNLLKETNITQNVFDATKRESRQRMMAIARHAPEHLWPLLHEFSGAEGSGIYQKFQSGDAKYMSYILQKS